MGWPIITLHLFTYLSNDFFLCFSLKCIRSKGWIMFFFYHWHFLRTFYHCLHFSSDAYNFLIILQLYMSTVLVPPATSFPVEYLRKCCSIPRSIKLLSYPTPGPKHSNLQAAHSPDGWGDATTIAIDGHLSHMCFPQKDRLATTPVTLL